VHLITWPNLFAIDGASFPPDTNEIFPHWFAIVMAGTDSPRCSGWCRAKFAIAAEGRWSRLSPADRQQFLVLNGERCSILG
jgi:hypothetical protein